MKKNILLVTLCSFSFYNLNAQFAYGDHWYENPLGFEPLNLHTSMGAIVPAAVVVTCLLLTKKRPDLTDRLSIYNETGLSWGYKYPYTFIPQNNTGINFHIRKFMSIGIESTATLPRDNFNETIGFCIRSFARFYIIHKKKWKLYFESGGGFIYFRNEFPKPTDRDFRSGTHWNGLTKYGFGCDVRISRLTSALFGIRHLHISNGNTMGASRNPSHDSNGLFLGLSCKL